MHAPGLFAIVLAVAANAAADAPSQHKSASPDRRWVVAWNCKGTWQPDSCSIALSRASDGKVFFTHQTGDRLIQAVWSSDSSRCVLLDAPDNANSYLWIFRIQGREVAREKLDYDKISADIEAAVPRAHREEPQVTRSGIEKIEWPSPSHLRLHILYNSVPVIVGIDVAVPNSPKVRVLSYNET
jgi:hypothetical protein